MALGELVLEDSGQITGIRVLSTDASGTTLELNLQLSGTIRGVGQNTLWTYTMLQRPDGSLYGQGNGVLTTVNGDVIHLIGSGSGKANPGGTVRFCTMLHPHGATGQNADLNAIGLAGEYEVAADGTATNKCWEWK
ncbi:MAG TPA: hypothetical protein EYM31_04845 [Acidobacteria bacterium]|nr:hypothetical protein [Acidobacteriota bacterium]|tara:strand:+ start:719 stop:1126 length:408 start_codon:yes stop_codon:yes gene_type:complete